MEKYLELIRLAKKRKMNMDKELVCKFSDLRILTLSEKLNVLGVYEQAGKFTIQLSELDYLLALGCNQPRRHVGEDIFNPEKIWIHYEVEINGIIFMVAKNELKEEHKKLKRFVTSLE